MEIEMRNQKARRKRNALNGSKRENGNGKGNAIEVDQGEGKEK